MGKKKYDARKFADGWDVMREKQAKKKAKEARKEAKAKQESQDK